jgi:holo-[acyl-carrier protein] synthase
VDLDNEPDDPGPFVLPRPGAPEHSRLAEHLAARWAGKEAVVKAWSAALFGQPPPIPPDETPWQEIAIVSDRWGRPSVSLTGTVAAQMSDTLDHTPVTWQITLTHDGDYAIALVLLSTRTPR